MTQGIRAFTNEQFARQLPKFSSKELTGAEFRRRVMEATVAKFGISVASAATHYNHAFKAVKALDASLVEGLGRSDEKKGGRPVQNPVTVVVAKSGKVVAEGISAAKARELIQASLAKGKVKLALKDEVAA